MLEAKPLEDMNGTYFIDINDDELINNANVVMRTEVIQALLEKTKEKFSSIMNINKKRSHEKTKE